MQTKEQLDKMIRYAYQKYKHPRVYIEKLEIAYRAEYIILLKVWELLYGEDHPLYIEDCKIYNEKKKASQEADLEND